MCFVLQDGIPFSIYKQKKINATKTRQMIEPIRCPKCKTNVFREARRAESRGRQERDGEGFASATGGIGILCMIWIRGRAYDAMDAVQ